MENTNWVRTLDVPGLDSEAPVTDETPVIDNTQSTRELFPEYVDHAATLDEPNESGAPRSFVGVESARQVLEGYCQIELGDSYKDVFATVGLPNTTMGSISTWTLVGASMTIWFTPQATISR